MIRLCLLEEIADGAARGFSTGAGRDRVDVLVARKGDKVFAYLNLCPHLGTPLDWAPDRFMAPDGRHLQCATHAARFRVHDGLCVAGPCVGDALTPVPAHVEEDGSVAIEDPRQIAESTPDPRDRWRRRRPGPGSASGTRDG
ncbi:MAG: Rieske (2Fe-2S) protein [Azospirillaceae bacterium]